MPDLNPMTKYTRPLGYAAVACLVLVLIVGALAFLKPRNASAQETVTTAAQQSPSRPPPARTPCSNPSSGACLTLRQTIATEVQAKSSVEQAEAARRQTLFSQWATFGAIAGIILSLLAVLLSAITTYLTHRNTKAQLRAYISIETGGAGSQADANGDMRYEFEVRFKNSGTTPALELRHVMTVSVVPHPVPVGFDFTLPFPPTHSVTSLGAGQAESLRAAELVPAMMHPQILGPHATSKLLVYGVAEYADIFGRRWLAEFAYSISIIGTQAVWERLQAHSRAT